MPFTPIAALQTEYSLTTRNPEIAVLDTCKELGITFVAFSPVARGMLSNGVSDPQTLLDTDIRKTMPRFIGENWEKNRVLVDAFNALAAKAGVTPAQLSLGWGVGTGRAHRCDPGYVEHRSPGGEHRPLRLASVGRTVHRAKRAD